MNKKVILVVPSKSLVISKLGKIIDSYDIVCRMNNSGRPELLNGDYKEIIGNKKDIWFCKNFGLFNIFPNPGYDKLVGFVQGNAAYPMTPEVISKFSHVVQQASKKGAKTLNDCIKTLKEFNNNTSRPSCGILSIFYLLEKYDKIHICGMDGFKGGHWYGNKFISSQDKSDILAAKGSGAHNVILEQEYINYLIQKDKIIKIDE